MNENDFKEALNKCVRCGGCKAECPTYNAAFSETETARGRLRLLHAFVEGVLEPSKKLNEKIFNCILCGECSRYCPLGIDVNEVIYYARKLLKRYDRKRSLLRILSKILFNNTNLSIKLTRPIHNTINKVLIEKKLIPEGIEFRESALKNIGIFKAKEKIGRIAVFTGCTVQHVYPELSASLVNVLNALNYEVIIPKGEVCCGAPFRALGMEDTAIKYAEKNFSLLSNFNVDAIVSLCPTCVIALKKQYSMLIKKELNNVYDISTFLRKKITNIKTSINSTITYHEPCHEHNLLNVKNQPRELIKMTGADLVEPYRQTCCGFGGTFSVSFKKLSENILKDTCDKLIETDSEAIVTTCPNCIFQLSKSIKEIPIYHLIELIEEALC